MSILMRSAAMVLLSFAMLGCVQPVRKRVHAEYDQRAASIRAVGIVSPDISYYNTSLGSAPEKNDAASRQANDNVVAAIKTALAKRGFEPKLIVREGDLKPSLDEIVDLFNRIAWSYRVYVLTPVQESVFPHKAASFDYSVGSLNEVLDACKVDALILVDGGGAESGFLIPGGTTLLIAIVDRTGALLWFEPYTKPGEPLIARDIRDPALVQSIVEEIFTKLPEVKK
ncbi:MAG: hypothetical protein HZA20_00740 [Nitrospirae bacterium]|nr:hypothetical protein [Nitrospirota bacterium]